MAWRLSLKNDVPCFKNNNNAIWSTLGDFLSDITQNKFTTKDSFTFVDEIITQDSDLYMASLDVDGLFNNISLDETIDICVKKLFKTPDTLVKGISKNDFRDLLNLATKESFFTFNNKFYIQVDGVAMGSL